MAVRGTMGTRWTLLELGLVIMIDPACSALNIHVSQSGSPVDNRLWFERVSWTSYQLSHNRDGSIAWKAEE